MNWIEIFWIAVCCICLALFFAQWVFMHSRYESTNHDGELTEEERRLTFGDQEQAMNERLGARHPLLAASPMTLEKAAYLCMNEQRYQIEQLSKKQQQMMHIITDLNEVSKKRQARDKRNAQQRFRNSRQYANYKRTGNNY